MFSEVRQGILPLALRNIKRRGDLERAGLLIESLAKHWRDSKPFELLIIAPNRDAGLLRTELPRFPNINVDVRREGDFFRPFSPFYWMTGWYRQQIVKLHVPAVLGFGGFLTLDSDVCCVGDFDSQTFLQHERALSRWEPKQHHEWWRSAAEVIGIPYDPRAHGLSVTPNILHGDLARQRCACARPLSRRDDVAAAEAREPARPCAVDRVLALHQRGRDQWDALRLSRRVGHLLHRRRPPLLREVVRLGGDDFERLVQLPTGTDPGGKFIIVQSHARIPLQQVRDYCLSFAG